MWLRLFKEDLVRTGSSLTIVLHCSKCGKEVKIEVKDSILSALAVAYRHVKQCMLPIERWLSKLTIEKVVKWLGYNMTNKVYYYYVKYISNGRACCKICNKTMQWTIREIRNHFMTEHPDLIIRLMIEQVEREHWHRMVIG